jgi:hypothetical protein
MKPLQLSPHHVLIIHFGVTNPNEGITQLQSVFFVVIADRRQGSPSSLHSTDNLLMGTMIGVSLHKGYPLAPFSWRNAR